jgi:hypothetical protein
LRKFSRFHTLWAGSRGSPCAPKAALGKSGIDEGLLSDTYPEGQAPAKSLA